MFTQLLSLMITAYCLCEDYVMWNDLQDDRVEKRTRFPQLHINYIITVFIFLLLFILLIK